MGAVLTSNSAASLSPAHYPAAEANLPVSTKTAEDFGNFDFLSGASSSTSATVAESGSALYSSPSKQISKGVVWPPSGDFPVFYSFLFFLFFAFSLYIFSGMQFFSFFVLQLCFFFVVMSFASLDIVVLFFQFLLELFVFSLLSSLPVRGLLFCLS